MRSGDRITITVRLEASLTLYRTCGRNKKRCELAVERAPLTLGKSFKQTARCRGRKINELSSWSRRHEASQNATTNEDVYPVHTVNNNSM